MKNKSKNNNKRRLGLAIVLVVVSIVILALLGVGVMSGAYGVRLKALRIKNEAIAMLAAEAGHEQAVFWMSQQQDMLSAIRDGNPGTSGTIQFEDGSCNYSIGLHSFAGAKPVYKITSVGQSGTFTRTTEVLIVQAMSGWDMGMCRVPSGSTATTAVNYASGEVIAMPLHINKYQGGSTDDRDIYISGSPQFSREVSMGESRYRSNGYDKYAGVMNLFQGGIYFNQPDSKITDEACITAKIERFENSTKNEYRFTPVAGASLTNKQPAVQLEFFASSGIGKVQVTNNCTVRGYKQSSDSRTWDLRIVAGSGGTSYERYYIYTYHVRPQSPSPADRFIANITDTYVTQSFGGIESEPGGQIFVDGNVIIGGSKTDHSGNQLIKGKITVVATGNIWIADAILLDGTHDANGMPSEDNPNALGLIAQKIIKVVDPGRSRIDGNPVVPSGYVYEPIGINDSGYPAGDSRRHLPDPMTVEAAMTVGGGGWGAENVVRGSYGGRKEASGSVDDLVVRGTIAEAVRGVVGVIGSDGFSKNYYLDERLLEGILPGDMWLRGKFVSAPAGWHDYRVEN